MKSLRNDRNRHEVLDRLARLGVDAHRRWGKMSAHQMVCHLSDALRAALGEKHVAPSVTLFKRSVLKPLALWVPIRWPRGFKTHPETDQELGGTTPVEFASDLQQLRTLFDRFCNWRGEYAPHGMFGQMSRRERMRHAYLHFDHHLRQFGV